MKSPLTPEQRQALQELFQKTQKQASAEAQKIGEGVQSLVRKQPLRRVAALTGLTAGIVAGADWWREEKTEDFLSMQEATQEKNARAEMSLATRRVVVGDQGRTIYHLLLSVVTEDNTYRQLSASRQRQIIDSAIALTRQLNPKEDLDDFQSLIGKELLFPALFTWHPVSQRVLSGTRGGYSAIQVFAEQDGLAVRQGSQEQLFQEAMVRGVNVPREGEGYFLRREGSEDSPAILDADVVASIKSLGKNFSNQVIKQGGKGWSIMITDMLRDPEVQAKRKSVQASTHATGRSFDVADGRFIAPDGQIVTWSIHDAKGRPQKGPQANLIDMQLRPLFEEVALKEGWVLYKEPGHWHVYVPKETIMDLRSEWKEYENLQESSPLQQETTPEQTTEIPELIHRIDRWILEHDEQRREQGETLSILKAQEALLSADIRRFFREIHKKEIVNPFSTALEEFPSDPSMDPESAEPVDARERRAWLKARAIDLIRRSSAKDISALDLLQGSVVDSPKHCPPFSDLEAVWKWKKTSRIFPRKKKEAEIIAKEVGVKSQSLLFSEWYRWQREIQESLQKDPSSFHVHPELLRYMGPSVMLATIHAEFFSTYDGHTFVETIPTIFEGYNLAFAPSTWDKELSAGLAQLTVGTLTSEMSRSFGDAIRSRRVHDKTLRSIVIPSYNTKDPRIIADAMVLHTDSALFWAYLSLLHHVGNAFTILMNDPGFSQEWTRSNDADRLRFIGAFTPFANNGGKGRAEKTTTYLLKQVDDHSLGELAELLQKSTTHATAVRGAKKGLEAVNAFLEKVEKD